jgi:hypothetical protein
VATAASFRLTRYFAVAGVIAFGVVGIALYLLERAEGAFLRATQREQAAFFAQTQADFMTQQQAAARQNLLAEHEMGHVTLARVLANATWESRFAPLVARAQRLPADECRQLPAAERAPCFAKIGAAIQSLPGFNEAHQAVSAMMRGSSVFKVKVYDLRGLTVYSSELAQVGEDKADNKGWAAAMSGQAATELVHRDKFSAFEGVVENRDLIQSYVPATGPGSDRIQGVFEIYSDVTALLAQVQSFSARFAAMTGTNQAKLEQALRDNENKVAEASRVHFTILAGLFVVLYLVLWVLVRNAQRTVDAREKPAP